MIFHFRPVKAQNLYTMPAGATSHVSSPENRNGRKGNGGKSNAGAKGSAFTSIKAGQSTDLLNIKAAGIVQRIWVTIDDRSPEMLRGLRIRMYWDGSNTAAVDVPFGDFFCANLGEPVAFQSALFANPEGRSFNCYIPMPFNSGARITLSNESGHDLGLLFFDVDYITLLKPNPENLFFHAAFNETKNAPVGQDAVLLPEVNGRGRFLGVSVGVNTDPVYGNTWWGEGEVKMYIDGDQAHPSINGTGSEDYIGDGWMEGVFAGQYQGCLVANGKAHQYAFYRFHVPDAIYFTHDFRAGIQQLGGWFAKDVKAMKASGVPMALTSLSGAQGFMGLMDSKDPAEDLNKAGDQDWLCFYRSDDYAVTAYYYLDKP
jgi:Protein of unknown function (DUF2961)